MSRGTRLLVSLVLLGVLLGLASGPGAGRASAAHVVVTTIPLTTIPLDAAVDPGAQRLYVSTYIDGSIVIDTATNAVVAALPVPSSGGLAVAPATHHIYVPNYGGNTVAVLDGDPASPTVNTVLATVTVGLRPIDAAVDPASHAVYVANENSNSVSVIDGAANTVTNTIPVGVAPYSIALDPVPHRAYVVNSNSNTLTVIDTSTNTVTTTVPTSGGAGDVTVDLTTHRVYVSNFFSNTVTVYDGDPASPTVNTIVATAPVGVSPFGLGVDPATHRVFVANYGGNTVNVLDGDPASPTVNTIVETVTVGQNPYGLAVDPLTHHAYTANFSDNTVSVIGDRAATLDRTSLAFGDQGVGTPSAAQTITLSNTGDEPVTVSGLPITGANAGDFAVSQETCTAAPVPAHQTCAIAVTFTPAATGARSAMLTVQSDVPGGLPTVALSGAGIPLVALTVQTTGPGQVSPSSGAYPAGTTVTLTATPATDATLLGWTVDGAFRGWPATLTLTLDQPHTIVATFAALPDFSDVKPGDAGSDRWR